MKALEFKNVNHIHVPGKFIMHPVEFKDVVPFDPKRVYLITKPEGPSGAHCHLQEEEFFFFVQGSGTLVTDRGNGLEELPMTSSGEGVYIGNYIWHHFKDFTSDAVLVAISSTNYNPNRSDYIENYDEYLAVRDEKLTELYD